MGRERSQRVASELVAAVVSDIAVAGWEYEGGVRAGIRLSGGMLNSTVGFLKRVRRQPAATVEAVVAVKVGGAAGHRRRGAAAASTR